MIIHIVYIEETVMKNLEETTSRGMCNEIPALSPTVFSNFEYILSKFREMTISSIVYIEETVMKNSDTITFHKICSKSYGKEVSKFPEIIISLILHIEETVMKSRPSHLPCFWILNRNLSAECYFTCPPWRTQP